MFHNICQNSKLKKNPSTLYHVDKLISAGLGIVLDLTAGIVPCMKSALLHCKVTRVLHNKNDTIERENQYLSKTSYILTFKIYYKRQVVQGINCCQSSGQVSQQKHLLHYPPRDLSIT